MSLELNLLPKNQRNILKLMVPSLQRPIQAFLNIDSAKPKSGACIFFSCTSQGHNALPRPGLEPGLSDLEPSALTTGLLDKAVALVCLWYSWPRMLKVAPCMVVQLYIQIFRLDGLLLFCIIIGLCSVSSAIRVEFSPLIILRA